MGTTREQISQWFDEGVKKGATHMIVACDTYDWGDYPVYVMPDEDVQKKIKRYSGPNMQKVMEVYCLGLDKDRQLSERRAWHPEAAPAKRPAEPCAFCGIAEREPGRVLNSGKLFVSFLSNPRLRYGHCLVAPTRHVERPMNLESEEILAIYSEIQRLQRLITEQPRLALGCDVWQKYQPFMPEGPVKKNHVHFHVLPRHPEDRLFMSPEMTPWEAFTPLYEKERRSMLEMLRA